MYLIQTVLFLLLFLFSLDKANFHDGTLAEGNTIVYTVHQDVILFTSYFHYVIHHLRPLAVIGGTNWSAKMCLWWVYVLLTSTLLLLSINNSVAKHHHRRSRPTGWQVPKGDSSVQTGLKPEQARTQFLGTFALSSFGFQALV